MKLSSYFRKTKIVCTIGPASDDEKTLRRLIYAGMNVARLNFSHGSHAEHKVRFDRIKKVSAECGIPVAIMLDTKGPEIRTGLTAADAENAQKSGKEGGGTVSFAAGDLVEVDDSGAPTFAPAAGKRGHVSLSLAGIAAKVKPGVRILIADGLFELDVLETDGKTVLCKAKNNAKIGSKKNVNLIGIHSGLPVIGEQDKADIAFGNGQGIDFISASFLSFPHEIAEIHEFLRTINCTAKIIAKIESGEGLENIQKISALADGVMVARGDLAVQIPDEQIPLAQKRIVDAARRHCKPVIIATQMLDSMIINPRPTRAELTDVANAIFDGADAVMLSGETANGAYPVEAVKTMSKICMTVEQSAEFKKSIGASLQNFDDDDIGTIVSRKAYEMAHFIKAKMIITPTYKGTTALRISTFRPDVPVLAVTPSERTLKHLLLYWGVIACPAKIAHDSEEMIQNALKTAIDTSLVKISDKVLLAAGLPLHSPLPVNTLRVLIIGNILARSLSGAFANAKIQRASGRIVYAESAFEAREGLRLRGGEILVCPVLTSDYIPILRIVAGVICEGDCHIEDNILGMINPNLVWLTGVHNAARKFETGQSVTIDGGAFLVYEGTV